MKTALITGASSGIGKELAKIHAEKGGDLIVVARRQEKLLELKKDLEAKHPIQVTVIAKDLSLPKAAKELYEEVKDKNLVVDYLINNAGFGLRGKFYELDWARQMQMINLNMIALTELIYLFLPEMVARDHGKILNTSSTAALMPGPLQAIYFASKAYVNSLSFAIAEELHDSNVSITSLMPGATETEFAKTANLEETGLFKDAKSPRGVAEDGYNAMLERKINVISGLTFPQKMMMHMIPFTPKRIMLKQMRKMQEIK